MIVATIKAIVVKVKAGTSKKGRAYSFREQEALVALPSGEVRKVKFTLDDEQEPLAPGNYQPTAGAYYVDGFDGLALSMRARNWQAAK